MKNSIPPARLRLSVVLGLLCLVFSSITDAKQPKPTPPDGDLGNGNTAEGKGALFSLPFSPNSAANNTAMGFDALYHNTLGSDNTAMGFDALVTNTGGTYNTAIGSGALTNNTNGSDNTANGFQTLARNTNGASNTAMGFAALATNTTGSYNTASGSAALISNTTGQENTANGGFALYSNTTGDNNTATGLDALYSNTTGRNNTANGFAALLNNTTGRENAANGAFALNSNTTGDYNTANGLSALASNTNGASNTANGWEALPSNTTGSGNTANGWESCFMNTTGRYNTADGLGALYNNTTGNYNVALGVDAGYNLTTGDNNIDIGNFNVNSFSSTDVANQSNTIRIGHPNIHSATYIAGIRGVTTGNGDAVSVVIDSAGQLGTVSSSARFKKEIKPMDKNSEAIFELKPVTFHYNADRKDTPQFGLIAEEVAAVNPDLVVRDANGAIYTVRYDAVNAMLLNEFLKEHGTVEELKSIVAEQRKQIEILTVGLQKVNALVETTKSAPQVANNNR